MRINEHKYFLKLLSQVMAMWNNKLSFIWSMDHYSLPSLKSKLHIYVLRIICCVLLDLVLMI